MSRKLSINVCLLLILLLGKGCSSTPFFEHEYTRFRLVQLGMTEEQVIEILGPPMRSHRRGESYRVEGYAYKDREIKNKVFVYKGVEAIAYIYFDSNSVVEDIFVGGS